MKMEPTQNTVENVHCYCSTTELEFDMLTCNGCSKRFHQSCLRSGRPSPLAGDIYFNFTCANCSADDNEVIKRKKLQWTLVVMLALYNLQLQGGGKCGYYRWREHICRYIDRNWFVLFGNDRKKSATWHGTVAGVLSTGTNRFFVSGMEVLGETGWWALKSPQLPSLDELDAVCLQPKNSRKRQAEPEVSPLMEGTRKKNPNVVEAAVALKEKKANLAGDVKPKIKKSGSKTKSGGEFSFPHKLKLVVSHTEMPGTSGLQDDQRIIPKIIIKKEVDDMSDYASSNVNWWMKEELKPELDLDIEEPPSDMFSYRSLLDVPESVNLFDNQFSDTSYDKLAVKPECESDEENSNLSKPVGMSKKFLHPDTSRKRKAVTKDESPVKENVSQDSKYEIMSPYEEEQLLEKLKNYPTAMSEKPELRRLYRKLVVRKLKREYKLPVFDIDAEVRTLRGIDPPEGAKNENDTNLPTQEVPKMTTILDRYQIGYANVQGKSQQRVSFFTRLMGLDEEEVTSIVSPYTERILKPFIFRDYTLKPPKLLLLEELLQRTNRNNPDWVPPQHSPIDYCYVRPQHIPAINAMCREFFWPGIDMSESLQYPDFSCVALYKKVIIGFAFMVPDVKYNEAYITFIFCHPDWRRCGISTFMLYHLIQTCMGKDVTLHVSATSTAVFLYQKFGFKVEEYIRDFYDKYLPADSKECRHALFLRLSR